MDELLTTAEHDHFTITDAGQASWAIRKIKEREAERDRYVLACNAAIDDYRNRATKENERCDIETQFLRDRLWEWFQEEPKRELKASWAIDLPDGKLSLSKPKPDYERDDAVLLAYLKESAPEYVKVPPPVVAWGELKKAITDAGEFAVLNKSGEIIPGIKVIKVSPEFKIK